MTQTHSSRYAARARPVPAETVAADIPKAERVLQQPQIETGAPMAATSVRSVVQTRADGSKITRHIYAFDTMVVGAAVVAADAWTGQGILDLSYCEYWLDNETAKCAPLAGYPGSGNPVDTHIVDSSSGSGSHQLSTLFSWHGFQYVVVTVRPPEAGSILPHFRGDGPQGARRTPAASPLSFRASLSDVTAVPIGGSALALPGASRGADAPADINFSGGVPGHAETLQSIHAIATRSVLQNTVTGMPTDCPTREKHGWLGDAMSVASATMYTRWAPTIHEYFLEQVIDGQNATGNVPVVVPCHGGVDSYSKDYSWTAGLPRISRWLLAYYGDAGEKQVAWWPHLKQWVDAQLLASNGSLPTAATYGDLAAPWLMPTPPSGIREREARACSAGNFMLGLSAMVDVAEAVAPAGSSTDAAVWSKTLGRFQAAYKEMFWDPNSSSFAGQAGSAPAGATQTVDAVAVDAGAGSEADQTHAVATLLADVVAQNYTLSVGNIGSQRLFGTLSGAGPAGHDAALTTLVGRNAYPSFRFWLDEGATTCWEGWSNLTSPHYDHHLGSRNHGWLCGGVLTWLYADVGGITPGADGFATVNVAPKISKTLGPSSVSMTLMTIRGLATSNWTRAAPAPALAPASEIAGGDVVGEHAARALTLQVTVPIGATANVELPLLDGGSSQNVCVVEGGGGQPRVGTPCATVWAGAGNSADGAQGADGVRVESVFLRSSPAMPGVAPSSESVLRLTVASGAYTFQVYHNANDCSCSSVA